MALIDQIDDPTVRNVRENVTGKRSRPLGVKEKAIDFICRVLRRFTGFRAYRLMVFEPCDIPDGYGGESCRFESRIFRGSELATLAGKHGDLGEKFIARSICKGDWCVAHFDGDKLVNYGCCSSQPTMLGEHFLFEFPDDYFYMYRGFTMREYRGNRLNGLGMAKTVRDGANHGKRGFVGLIEVQNVPSLRSADHGGHRREGLIITFCLFGRWMTLHSPGCRRYACRLVRR